MSEDKVDPFHSIHFVYESIIKIFLVCDHKFKSAS